MTDKNYIYKKLSDGRYIKEIDNKTEHLATAEEDAKLATDIRSLLQGEQGQSGTSGTSGESGTSGINGQKGDIGRTGLTGPRGQNGTSGSSGSSGQDGSSGINGQDGTSGINGRKGDKGDKGDRGFPGLQGPAGAKGQDGIIGGDGTSGTSGINGSSGTSGQNGTAGTSGITGSSGSSGTSGVNGTSGTSGQNGTAGTSGVNGSSGTSGITGSSGSSGTSGQNGTAGTSGQNGTSGTSGVNGSSGTSGITGSSGSSGTSGVNGQNGQSSSYFLYKAIANTYTGNPDHTYILWNNATQTGATAIHINHLTKENIDVDIFLGLIRQGSNLTIQHTTNSGEYQTWNVSATPTLVSGANNYWIVPVTLIDSTVSFTNNEDIFVAISADSGTSGSSGSSGLSGSSGTSGLSGSSGTSGLSGSSGTSGLVPFMAISTAAGSSTPLIQNINVISSVITIPANTFTAPNSFKLTTYFNHTGTLNNFQQTLYVTATFSAAGTTFSNATPTGWTLLATGLNGGSRITCVDRFVHIYTASGSGDGTKVFPVQIASILDTGGSSTPIATLAIDWTQTQYIMLASRNTSAGPSLTARCEYFTLASYRN